MNASPATTEKTITPIQEIDGGNDNDLADTLFNEFLRMTRKSKQGQRGAFKSALRKFAGAKLASLSDKDPIVLTAASPQADARALDKIVSVQFLEPGSPWAKFSQFMEVNIHAMVNGTYGVDRVYWNFPASSHELCNELIRLIYLNVGQKFEVVFALLALDHKQLIEGRIADQDVHIDRERGERQTRVMLDLIGGKTTQLRGSGELNKLPEPKSLAEVLREETRQEMQEVEYG